MNPSERTIPGPLVRAIANAFPDPRPFRFDTGARSDVGKIRKENEDSYVLQPGSGLWAVADGMGGYEAGKLASSTVADALGAVGQAVSAADLLARVEDRVIEANRALRQFGRENGLGTFGTTVVALLIYERYFACSWCGDSRTYLLRDGQLTQVSRDHTEVQDLIDRGQISREEARRWPGRNVITRAIGVSDVPELDLEQGLVEEGDVFVLCSDGLTGHVDEAEVLAIVQKHAGEAEGGMQAACDELVALTLDRGATDNVTVITVACRSKDEITVVLPAGLEKGGSTKEG